MELYIYVIAILGSAVAGAINVMAGNGSAITLTILTELIGLPGNMANGTNRIGVLTQTWASNYAFYQKGKIDLQKSWVYIIFTVIGAIGGILVAVWVSNEQFRQVFRFLLLLMLVVILVKPKRWLRETDVDNPLSIWIAIPLFLILGFYGGFIQMGMGVFFLASMVLIARFSMMDSNVVKSIVVGIYTILAVAIFQWKGLIDWKIGLIMAIGQTVGGYFMAIYASTSPKANLWAHRILVVVVLLAIGKLFNLHEYFL